MPGVMKVNIRGIPQLKNRMRKLKGLPNKVSDTALFFAKMYNKALQQQFISQRKRAPRKSTAEMFKAERLSKFQSVVKLPAKAIALDSMKPHYVSLKRGRAITKWARKFYSPNTIFKSKGLSKVRRGPKGGVKGFLYVTPDPFIDKAIARINPKISPILRQAVLKQIQTGG